MTTERGEQRSERLAQSSGERSLVRAVGVWGLAASIVNVTIGGGIFRLPAAAASALGPAAPAAYVACAAAMGLIVLCFAEAGSRVSTTGGLYTYVEVAFGPFVGFVSGAMLWFGVTAAMAAVSSFFADSVAALFPVFSPSAARALLLLVVLGLLALLNIAGVRGANRFNASMTIAKLLPLALLIVVGVGAIRMQNLHWDVVPSAGSLARASAVSIFAFLGVETALAPSGEVRDSARTVPRAILIAMVGVTLLYIAIQTVTQGILGAALPEQKTPLAEAAAVVMGPSGRTLILAGMMISMFGYVSGMTLSVPRMLYAFARDGFLPARIASIHPRTKAPWIAIAVQTVIVVALAVSGSFEKLAVTANGAVLIVYFACCAGVLRLRRLGVEGESQPFRIPFASAIPIAAMATIAWLLSGLAGEEWKAVLAVLAGVIVVFVAGLPSRRQTAVLRGTG